MNVIRLVMLVVLAAGASAGAQAQGFAIERQEMRAQLLPLRYTTLAAEQGAKLSRIAVREGERFEAGLALIEFDCTLQNAQMARAKAQAKGAESTWEGNRRLSELNAVGQVELRTSEAELAKARAEVAYLQANLDKCVVKAPFAGRVAEQKAREQQFVQPGQALLDILDDSALELEFIVPTRWLSWLKPEHRFKVRIDDTGKTYPVRLVRIGARADPVSQSVKAAAVVDGAFPELMAGMSGRLLLSAPRNAR